MVRVRVVFRRLAVLAGRVPEAWPEFLSCSVTPTCAQSKEAPSVLARLVQAGILFWAIILAALLQGHVAYADPADGRQAAGQETVDAPDIRVRIDSGLLTLQADDASLADVLTVIGQQSGIEIIMQGDLDSPVTKSFVDEPLGGAIADLLRDTIFVMTYGKALAENDPPPLVQIRVIARSASPAAPVTPSTGNYTATASTGDYSEDHTEAAIAARRAMALGFEPVPENDVGLFAELAGLENNQRQYAMQWLGEQGDAEAIGALGRFLALDDDPAIRNEAALALGDIGNEAASQALVLGLGDRNPDVRFQIVEAMGGVAGQSTTLVLGQILFSEPDPEVRISAIAGLGRWRSEAARAFLEAATEDQDLDARRIANDILANWDFEN